MGEDWHYIYSKYAPDRVKVEPIRNNVKFILLLGGGLGYEWLFCKENYDGPVYVFEPEPIFQKYLFENYGLSTTTLEQLNMLDYSLDFQIIENYHLAKLNAEYYRTIKKIIFSDIQTKPKICLLTHGSLQRDCEWAFQKLGYETIVLSWSHISTIKKELILHNPKYVFSINFSLNLDGICGLLNIPYLSWTVDTPAYSLFSKQVAKNSTSYKFIYDEEIVDRLKKQAIPNVFYLPVATNVTRYDDIKLTEAEKNLYGVDVSFLGNSCGHNEYMNIFKGKLSKDLTRDIDDIVNRQVFNTTPIINEAIDLELVNRFEMETQYQLFKEEEPLLTKKERLSYFLGRYHSYIERIALVKGVAQDFNVKVYGDDFWEQDSAFRKMNIYQGKAENFIEMPKVFKASKININNIRCFVESGLPQRVFDVLACEGFLITNSKRDIEKYFVNNRDLVIYRDLQDLKEIIAYYLQHEEERQEILKQGYQAVQEHTFEKRLKAMLEIAEK